LLRAIQYFARFYSWYLFRTNYPTKTITPWNQTKKQLSLVRKAMRLGKNVEHLKAAAVAYDSKNMDPVLKFCAVGRQLGYATYLTFDAATFVCHSCTLSDAQANPRQLNQAGIRPSKSAANYQKQAFRFWLTGITLNIVAGVYTLVQLRQKEAAIDKKDGEGVVEAKKIQRERNATNLQLISDLADWIIPTAGLGYANFDEGIVGLAGTTSSLLAIYSTWRKTA
jgi:peroxin-11B